MNKKTLYEDYLSKLEEALITNNNDSINYILEFLYTSGLPENDQRLIDDILQEATLYSELGEIEYKEEALRLIEEFK